MAGGSSTTVRTKPKGSPDRAYMKPIAVVKGDLGSLTCSMSKREIVIKENRIFAGQRQVATVDGDQWEVDGHNYQVTIVDRGEHVA